MIVEWRVGSFDRDNAESGTITCAQLQIRPPDLAKTAHRAYSRPTRAYDIAWNTSWKI